jgi:hypothetical protein
MITVLRKSVRTLKRLAAVFGGQMMAPNSRLLDVQVAPVALAKAKVAENASVPVCPACGAAAGVRKTLDAIGGQMAGECMACGTLRIPD